MSFDLLFFEAIPAVRYILLLRRKDAAAIGARLSREMGIVLNLVALRNENYSNDSLISYNCPFCVLRFRWAKPSGNFGYG